MPCTTLIPVLVEQAFFVLGLLSLCNYRNTVTYCFVLHVSKILSSPILYFPFSEASFASASVRKHGKNPAMPSIFICVSYPVAGSLHVTCSISRYTTNSRRGVGLGLNLIFKILVSKFIKLEQETQLSPFGVVGRNATC